MAKDKLPQPKKEFFPKKAKFQIPGQARISTNRIKVNKISICDPIPLIRSHPLPESPIVTEDQGSTRRTLLRKYTLSVPRYSDFFKFIT